MKINAVSITSRDLKKIAEFYELLGFQFPEIKEDEQHVEALPIEGSTKLMIDSKDLIENILGEDPKPGNHSAFAIEFDTATEVDEVVNKVKNSGHKVVREPWNAPWGQRYAIISDPDGYLIDLYAKL